MRVILDTNVFFHPAPIAALWSDERPTIVPSVVFAERARQLFRDRGVTAAEFAGRIADEGWYVEPFGPTEAARVATRIRDERVWRKHFRDAMIAGHVRELDELWTYNAKDFLAVGLDERHLVDLAAKGPPPVRAADLDG